MKLVRMALIFGAGYVLGRPEGRRKIAELAQRPEVKQAREQAVSTVSSGLETGKQRLSSKVSEVKDKKGEPSFPERGARPDGPPATAAPTTPGSAAPVTGTPAGTASNASSPGTAAPSTTATRTTSPGTTSPGTPASPASTGTSTGTSSGTTSTAGRSTGTKPSGTSSTDPDAPTTPPTSTR